MKNVKCLNCNIEVTLSADQQEFVASAIKKRIKFIMLNCPHCGLGFGLNPLESDDLKNDEFNIRTPISGVHGYVSIIDDDDEKFYGCDETGAIWRHKTNLFRDIELIIKRYSHREFCYKHTIDGWTNNPMEPDNIDELIDNETNEEIESFERD